MNIKEIVASMTLEEKCDMLSGKSFWESRDIERLGIPAAFLADGPHGIRKQAEAADHLGLNESLKATCFPTAATMANTFNTALGEQVGTALGQEAVAQKVNVLLGPGLNIKRNPLCGRNFEYFSEDPYLAGKMAAAYVRGIQSQGVASCLKHYAANNQEYRRMVVDTIVDERTLREIYLTNFEIAVKEGKSKTIMSAYNKINGDYANESKHLLVDILREAWGFEGIIISDWGGQNDRVAAVRTGAELEMPSSGGETSREVVKAVRSGALDEKLVDECVERLLEVVFDTEKVFESYKESSKKPKFNRKAHHDLAYTAAAEGAVLLENKNGALPLQPEEKVAVIGDFARLARFQGAGSSGVNPTERDDTLEVIDNYKEIDYVGFEPGFERFGKKHNGLIKKAVALAKKADTVLVYIGLDEKTETEGRDRDNMRLPQNQKDLLKALKATGKKIIAVLSCGAAIETDFTDDCDALLHAYLCGQAGSGAIMDIIVGRTCPSGKLAESYPHQYEDCSSAKNFPGEHRNVEYREGIYVGYRYYEKAGVNVKYPFGYGLSYTTFAYSDLKVTDKGITFNITNTGAVSGMEAAQLYIGKSDSKIFRAKKELKGFVKVALNPGETKTVTIPFDEYSFRYFNVKTNKFEIEDGAYEIMVGPSSAETLLTGSVTQKGTTTVLPYEGLDLPSYESGKAADVSAEEFAKLYGKELPEAHYPFYKKKRLWAMPNVAIFEMKWARGWIGRLFAKVSALMPLGMGQMPLRGLVRFGGGLSTEELESLTRVFNGGTRKWSKALSLPIGFAASPAALCAMIGAAPWGLLFTKNKFLKFLGVLLGVGMLPVTLGLGIPALLMTVPGLLWDLRRFFVARKIHGAHNRIAGLRYNGKFENEIWKAGKTIEKLNKKGKTAEAEKLQAQITEWKKVPAEQSQFDEAEATIAKAEAKLAKMDAKYAKFLAKMKKKYPKIGQGY